MKKNITAIGITCILFAVTVAPTTSSTHQNIVQNNLIQIGNGNILYVGGSGPNNYSVRLIYLQVLQYYGRG